MFSKVLILALAAAVANCQILSSHFGLGGLGAVGGLPVYRSSALHGGLYSANGYGYGANLGRVGGLGALRTSGAIVGSGALGYGTGALYGGGYRTAGLGIAAPAIGAYKSVVAAPAAIGAYGAYGAHGVHGHGLSVHQAGPVNAAVHTIARTVDYRPVPYSGEPATVQDIDVPPQESPLRLNFQSKSSPLQVTQQHIPAEPGQVQVTSSEDEAQQVIHNVNRPVIQHVNEVVQPYRTLSQTVEPVIEQTHTNIAQGEGVRLTGLQSGVVGGTGIIAASGLGVAAPSIGAYGVGLRSSGLGLGLANSGLYGARVSGINGIYGSGLGLANSGLYGARVSGINGLYGSGLYGSNVYGSGLVNSGLYGARFGGLGGYGNYGSYGSYGLGSGIGLNGLSGLSTYGTTSKVGRIF